MNLTEFVRLILGVACILIVAFLLVGCNQQQKFTLERVPEEYRSCAAKIMPQLPDRAITYKELVVGYAELKRYAGTKDRCLKGLIRWADAQHSAYYRSY